jgi:hypothetical protein
MTQTVRINNIKAPLDADLSFVLKTALQQVGLKPDQVLRAKWAKKSVDARHKNNICFVCSIDCELAENVTPPVCNNLEIIKQEQIFKTPKSSKTLRPIVVGSGPAGMLAGVALAEAGLNPIILERGKDVDTRRRDVDIFWKTGNLNLTSNVQFGEGGAGTFSDGKLMTGIKKDQYVRKVLEEFVHAGAPDEILYLAKPHIGTDKLTNVVRNIRTKIKELGGEYLFEHQLVGLICQDDLLKGIRVRKADGIILDMACDSLILAIGHSARDTFEMLYRSDMKMTQKPFSVGVRIEHKQALINRAQYGRESVKGLGAADYKLAVHLPNGRSAYTFCMCPGGTVVAAASEKGEVATNGMSEYARDKENANAALLVGVDERDFGSKHPLAGMYFQRKIEEAAFLVGGRNYHAPAQTVGDFLAHRPSSRGFDVQPSYVPAVTWTSLDRVLPEEITQTMRAAIVEMDRKLRGFAAPDAVLTAPETRSSSPVRMERGSDMQSNIKGIYPCGEGAGYAGGITSAAADGLKAAEALILSSV